MDKRDLLDFDMEALRGLMAELGEPAFRAKQLYQMLARGTPFTGMLQLPAKLRERLDETCVANGVTIERAFPSRNGDAEKYLYRLRDGHLIEGVRMRYKYGDTLCVSTQVGCRMGCLFCASSLDGLARNLTCGEILGQIVAQSDSSGGFARAAVHNVVLMGSGEPFDNYDNVLRFLRTVRDAEGLNIGARRISLSTCGLPGAIERFSREGLPVTLSVSLHAPNDNIRGTIMPVAAALPIRELLRECGIYFESSGRRIIFEYALIKDINDAPEHARELASLLRGMPCHVNVIPLNGVPERGLTATGGAGIRLFLEELTRAGVSATRRRTLGDEVAGACGQLRRSYSSADA
ncbi:MAG: 23S rRNA (adenine(2503)-C(2))-methyltransferase RlmN [Oscillospiraceae bacterium]|jgi:23S rRNA (adenine2503-C2)-methyltransferase|nr:23S rRNA (adenine(2503)-C(2))-methyltransferase RlmN [Oscillospiraceae bacterium]